MAIDVGCEFRDRGSIPSVYQITDADPEQGSHKSHQFCRLFDAIFLAQIFKTIRQCLAKKKEMVEKRFSGRFGITRDRLHCFVKNGTIDTDDTSVIF